MKPLSTFNRKLAFTLVADELFDLTLYRSLREQTDASWYKLLDELIPIEEKHFAFWQNFFDLRVDRLNIGRRLKLKIMLFWARLLGHGFIHLLLESIEVHGIRKYLKVWDEYRDTELAEAIRGVLDDEFRHEDAIVSGGAERRISGEKIRNIFLGLNDGLVEILGAVSGFFAAFGDTSQVLVAGLTVSVAGAFSMAAGVFVSSGSEKEVESTQRRKAEFLSQGPERADDGVRPLRQAVIVGIAYLVGSFVPIFPVYLGAKNITASLVSAGIMISVISFILAFVSGMDIKRRVVTNLFIGATAVVVTYTIGFAVKSIFGVQV
ncbi:hypothetical protein A3H10_04535 [Candidatus Uhrbacteria bacterium RIFCSPLOWO2_12_FULL_46_10]|uniref:Rubrerythrin family protein n=1 Tax=Candidatus Uhrbacteria bacterium RIFCSPLOWO2_01_FULL_47_25 TaxID=1802402 RepID=A0A1F7UW38_9BACT|nr:MAG: hypothetical protein UX68_C0006G0012 [Parcubacteria group bacterium GW2011_GWA2_46_9]OGL59364.1 MAG: hypothetical protein A2752_05400 [Candidatus Uhrbacteria bacterium RIFCSPHIGHO2_01_FULL_46_23]OGL68999.1 MAG: hypothetical protein A3D60_04455 [Candidatus Uhrbacteria bacterium RIFCSPHIGHO2_02_FULL_47_29]OGL82490.1 MAG: hypothetical protein A2936_02425 [Candidatus Uhrbacteria bacterium RIFCSPLOWO2_01_FULL_47_25]OGL85924.1 MAG: hypothetical protein A3I37_01030 [Candidatus Uhrbacteria bact